MTAVPRSTLGISLPVDPLLTAAQIEAILGVAKGWAAKDRCSPAPRIPYVKMGRSVRYTLESVLAYIRSCGRSSTRDVSEAGGKPQPTP